MIALATLVRKGQSQRWPFFMDVPMTRLSKNNAWLPVGIAIGTALGIAMHNLALWLGIGVAIGAAMTIAQRRR